MPDTPDLGKLWKQLTDSVGGGMGEALEKLKKSSIGEQVQSWIGKGENKPVNADQLTQAIGQDKMDQIAHQAGTTPEQAAQTMAEKLPSMVDKMTPDGHLPTPTTIKDNAAATTQTMPTTAANAMGNPTTTAQQQTPRTNPPPM